MARTNVVDAHGGTDGGSGPVVPSAPVLLVGLGRGHSGKSTLLAEAAWRARSGGREVIVADGDAHRSKTLSRLFPDASRPMTDELPDMKLWLTDLLGRMVGERRSAVLDLGGGDRLLKEYGRDLDLVAFCRKRGIVPVALYVLGPEDEDLEHCLSIWEAGYFRPERALVALNSGVIREGRTVAGAFDKTTKHPGFDAMVREGGVLPILVKPLACMDNVMRADLDFYAAGAGTVSPPLGPVQEFMVESWLNDLEAKRAKAGVTGWLP